MTETLRPHERRSFSPSQSEGRRRMKVTPISESRPSMKAVAKGVNQVHACLEEHREKTEGSLGELKATIGEIGNRSVAEILTDHGEKLDGHGADISEIKDALGIGANAKKTVATMGRSTALWQQIIAITGGGMAILTAYKLLVAAWPTIWKALVDLNHVVLTNV